MQPDITVVNKMGGVQRNQQPCQPPRSAYIPVSKQSKPADIERSTRVLQQTAESTGGIDMEAPQQNLDQVVSPLLELCEEASPGSHASQAH